MKKVMTMTGLVAVMAFVGLAQAQQAELHGVVDVTYQGKYVWRGFDIFADKSAIQPGIDLDLYGTGFGLNVTGHRANSSGYELNERWDYSLYYTGSIYQDQSYATNYKVSYVYYNYPERSSSDTTDSLDIQELNAVLSWPNILPIEGLVPSYVLVKCWPTNSASLVGSASTTDGTASGFAHIFMLDYPLTVPGLLPETAEQVLNLHAEAIYNDGVGPAGQNVDHDWTNAVFGITTDFDLGDGFTFTPGIYYQITMDDSVNDDKDETWATVGLRYAF